MAVTVVVLLLFLLAASAPSRAGYSAERGGGWFRVGFSAL